MALRAGFRLLLVLVALESIESKNFSTKSFLRDAFVSQPFESTVYVISKQGGKFNKVVAEETCVDIGGYLAKLGAGAREFEHIKKSIFESGIDALAFYIGEANKDATQLLPHPLHEKSNCTIFVHLNGTGTFYVSLFASCDYLGHYICEVPLTNAEYAYTAPKQILQSFYVSEPHNDSVYLVRKRMVGFILWDGNENCKEYGGYLVEVDTADEWEFMKKVVIPKSQLWHSVFFTGGNDEATEGHYKWYNSGREMSMTDGTPIPWLTNQPDNHRGVEDCIVFTRKTYYGLWFNDYPCIKGGRYICEVPITSHTEESNV